MQVHPGRMGRRFLARLLVLAIGGILGALGLSQPATAQSAPDGCITSAKSAQMVKVGETPLTVGGITCSQIDG